MNGFTSAWSSFWAKPRAIVALSLLRPISTLKMRREVLLRPLNVMSATLTNANEPWLIVELLDGRRRALARGAVAMELHAELHSRIHLLAARPSMRPSRVPRTLKRTPSTP